MMSFQAILAYLLKPAMIMSTKEKIHLSWIIGLFVFLFLLAFQPFGVNNYRPDEAISVELFFGLGIFGVVTSLIIVINELVIYRLLITNFTRLTAIIWVIWSMLFMSTAMFCAYNLMGNFHDWNLSSYLDFIFNITMLSILPLAFLMIYLHIKSLRQSIDRAYQFPENKNLINQPMKFVANNGKDVLMIKVQDLLFIQAEDNYVNIHYLEDGIPTKSLLRQSLKKIESDLSNDVIRKCHRSYLVNFYHVNRLEGNRNKMLITLSGVSQHIPISRNYIDDITAYTSN